MASLSLAVGLGQRKSLATSAKLLASAYSCAERAQVSLDSLGGASSILLLTGLGTSLLLSRLSDAMIKSSPRLQSGLATRKTASGFTGAVRVAH